MYYSSRLREMNHFIHARLFIFFFVRSFVCVSMVNVIFENSMSYSKENFTTNAHYKYLTPNNEKRKESEKKTEFIWQQNTYSTYHQNTHVTALHALLMLGTVSVACEYCAALHAFIILYLYIFIIIVQVTFTTI